MKVSVSHKDQIISNDVMIADTLYSRLIGLMFKHELIGAEGLLLEPCNSIHTCFMKYPIDVIFLAQDNTVIKVIENLKPWRFTWLYFKASKTLEFPSGKRTLNLKVGDVLEVKNV